MGEAGPMKLRLSQDRLSWIVQWPHAEGEMWRRWEPGETRR